MSAWPIEFVEIGSYGNISPLHGIPILIKNNIATNDKLNNTGKYGDKFLNFWLNYSQLDLGHSWERKCLATRPSFISFDKPEQ